MLRRTWSGWLLTSALGVTALGGGTGCAGGNLKGVLLATDGASMQTVVRRADAARATAINVDRIMGNLPVDPESAWVAQLAFKKADAELIIKTAAADPEYAGTGKPVKVVPAEAWAVLLSKICSTESKAPSLYGMLNGDVHAQYAEISAQAKNVGKLKADITIEKALIDDKDLAAEKADHEAKKKELEDKLDQLKKDYDPKVDAFKKKLAADAAAAPPEVKKVIATTIGVLKRALSDAAIANTAAGVRYPLALPGLKDEVKVIVKRIAADTIERAVGTRPNMDKLAPEIKFSPVRITIGGLTAADVGKLNLEDAIKDIAERSKNYVVHVVTLLGYIDETREMLGLQEEILNEVQKAVGEVVVGEEFAEIDIKSAPANKRSPIPMEACVVVKEVVPVPAAPPPDAPKPDAKPDPKAKKPTKKGGK